jgi:hypothetical protein
MGYDRIVAHWFIWRQIFATICDIQSKTYHPGVNPKPNTGLLMSVLLKGYAR